MERIASVICVRAAIDSTCCSRSVTVYTGLDSRGGHCDIVRPGFDWSCDLLGDDHPGRLPDDYGMVPTSLPPAVRGPFNRALDVAWPVAGTPLIPPSKYSPLIPPNQPPPHPHL